MDEFITQERLQSIADLICLRPEKHIHQGLHKPPLAQIPRLYFDSQESIQKGIEFLNQCKRTPVVFCYVDFYKDLHTLLSQLNRPIILLSNSGDIGVTEEELPILEHPIVMRWFASNARIRHPKLQPVPIGIANSMWAHGNLEILQRVCQDLQEGRIQKRSPHDVFTCFRIDTNRQKREGVRDALVRQGYSFTQPSLDYESYLRTLATYRYTISPPGNGVDCHRVWECLYLQVIPIVEQDLLWDAWFGLPIQQVTSWDALILEDVPFNILTPFTQLSFWKRIIRGWQM